MHILFVRMVKSKFLAHFPVDHLSPPSRVSPYTPSVLICCIRYVTNRLQILFSFVDYYKVIIIYSLEFFISVLADGFSLELSDRKSLQIYFEPYKGRLKKLIR